MLRLEDASDAMDMQLHSQGNFLSLDRITREPGWLKARGSGVKALDGSSDPSGHYAYLKSNTIVDPLKHLPNHHHPIAHEKPRVQTKPLFYRVLARA